MKWPTAAAAVQALHVAATVVCLVLLVVGEPECAAALGRLGVLPGG